MNCTDFERIVHAYVDQEFDEREMGEIDAHVIGCKKCQAMTRCESWLKSGLKTCLSNENSPGRLKNNIISQLSAMDPPPKTLWFRYAWIPIPVALTLSIVFLWPSNPTFQLKPNSLQGGIMGQMDSAKSTPIVNQSVQWHQRNLPIEVTGPNGHRVSSWFEDKVDFPVSPPAFPKPRVSLLGGRLSHVRGYQAAYMLYDFEGHKLSVLAFDSKALKLNTARLKHRRKHKKQPIFIGNSRGYSVAIIEVRGVTYSVIANVNESELESLVKTAFK